MDRRIRSNGHDCGIAQMKLAGPPGHKVQPKRGSCPDQPWQHVAVQIERRKDERCRKTKQEDEGRQIPVSRYLEDTAVRYVVGVMDTGKSIKHPYTLSMS